MSELSRLDSVQVVTFAIRKAIECGELEREIERLRLEIDDNKAVADARATELLEANNRLLEERRAAETELAKLKAEIATEIVPPPAEEPREAWLGIDNDGRVHKSVDGPWSLIFRDIIGWCAMGLRPIRQGEKFRA